jgi:hypothetical protein
MLLVTGLARSGTTLLAECLDHHPEMMCVADPMNEFFKGFMRYAYFHIEGERKSVGYPIDHFFFSGSSRVSRFIDETDLNHPIPDWLKAEILERIAIRDGEYCPEIVEPIRYCQSDTFSELYLEILTMLARLYGKATTECHGIKTAWCEQLLMPLARTYPNMFFVNIIRDPRAVIASNYQDNGSRFPLFFNIRDWRKSVYYNWKYKNTATPLSDRYIGVRYEDIISNPEPVLRDVARIAGLEYSPEMTQKKFSKYNSSYGQENATVGISGSSVEKWKTVLPQDCIRQVEAYCSSEMSWLEYGRLFDELVNIRDVEAMQDNDYESLSEWCRDIVGSREHYEAVWLPFNRHIESMRLQLLRHSSLSNSNLETLFFYQGEYYRWLRGQNEAQTPDSVGKLNR